MSLLFHGPVRVYLQGENALLPAHVADEQITYWIGSEDTGLRLKDFRHGSTSAAKRILNGDNGFEFAEFFNQPALAKVQVHPDQTIDIELGESSDAEKSPVLWLGVLDDNMMPNYEVEWEYLRPLDAESTAITVLLKE